MDEPPTSMKNVSIPVWKTYLYQLQLQAPKPRAVHCQKPVSNRPPHYGLEWHGLISRQECDQIIGNEEGNFLVRESNNPPSSCTLAIRFNNETKNYKVYYDGAFYVGEKRFDTIEDLVHDGLISFYIEKHASNYIACMSEENNYAESPYVASKTALLARQKREPIFDSSSPMSHTSTSIHSSFQKQYQQNHSSPHQHSNTHQSQQQQLHHSFVYPTQQIHHNQHHHQNNHHHQQQNQHQQQIQQQLQAFQQPIIETTQSNSSLNQLDKENRLFNSSLLNNSLNFKFQQSVSSSKSNAIFDRFDIINSEKPHRFKSQNFKGPHWCDFCLNFMWGLVSQGVKCQDCGFQAHKKCSERAPPDCEPQMRFIKRIFGVDLTTLVKATSSIRPIVVEKCIEEIERRKGAIESEGLYRVSGFSDAIDELKLAFDRGDNVDFNEFKYNDIHIICSLLKLYLRQLPIPLITFDVYNRLIESLSLTNQKLNIIEIIKACIVELPPAHYLTLKYLMEHLSNSKNQMNPENLAIVFGPTLMRSINPDPILALKNTHKEQKITELLITNYASVFDK